MRKRKGSVGLALRKANIVSRNIGLKQINPLPYCQSCIQDKGKKEPVGSIYAFFSRFLQPTLPGDKTCPLQLPTTKTSLLKWIRAASNFIALIPSRSIRQFLAKCFGVEFQRTVSKFRKRKRKLLSCVPGLDKWGGRGGTRVGGVTRLSILSLILIWSRLHVRWGDPPHVTSPTWGPPPTCTQALRRFHVVVGRQRRQRNVPKSVMHVQSELLFS